MTLSFAEETVLSLIRNGDSTVKSLYIGTPYTDTYIKNLVRSLVKKGLVERDGWNLREVRG